MPQYRIEISRGTNAAPVQLFSRNPAELSALAKSYLSQMPIGHVAKVYEVKEYLIGTVLSRTDKEGLVVFDENFLDSSPKVEETVEGKETTTSVTT